VADVLVLLSWITQMRGMPCHENENEQKRYSSSTAAEYGCKVVESDISENGLLYKCGNQLHFYPSSKRNSWNCTYHRSTKEEQDKYDLEESFLVGSFTRWSI